MQAWVNKANALKLANRGPEANDALEKAEGWVTGTIRINQKKKVKI